MTTRKLSTTDAFVVVDLPDAPAAAGVVRQAPKVLIDGTTEIWDDHDRGLPYFKRITEKHTGNVPDDATIRERLVREQRVLLVITPDDPIEQWTSWVR